MDKFRIQHVDEVESMKKLYIQQIEELRE